MSEEEDELMMVGGIRTLSRIYLAHPYLCPCCRVKLETLIGSCNEYLELRNQDGYQLLLKRFNELFDKVGEHETK